MLSIQQKDQKKVSCAFNAGSDITINIHLIGSHAAVRTDKDHLVTHRLFWFAPIILEADIFVKVTILLHDY